MTRGGVPRLSVRRKTAIHAAHPCKNKLGIRLARALLDYDIVGRSAKVTKWYYQCVGSGCIMNKVASTICKEYALGLLRAVRNKM
jgi:hypothetical protein